MKTDEIQKRKKIVVFNDKEAWYNVEFMKDCGLIPYLLHKNHNCEVTFVGAKADEWTYLETHLKGAKFESLPQGTSDERTQYLIEHAHEIDCLIVRSLYPINWPLAPLYKKLNPNGKIYVGLDANSSWMDRIRWNNPSLCEFMEACDVIATSCTAMQIHLNQKWPWKIEHIPNGHYDFDTESDILPFENRENYILTVARIGIPEKANHIMLYAFAHIADQIPDWKLYLVGPIADEFKSFIQAYYERFPQLKERVIFTGRIDNKEELRNMYLKSKIFCLTSIGEGGTPNVIGEALGAGCVIATTKIDAWEEAIDYGRCGLACDINDAQGLAHNLLTLCHDENLQRKSEAAYSYSQTSMNLEKIVARLYLMLFGEN